MQLDAGQLEELRNAKERLSVLEGERDRARQELKEMKKMADEANMKINEAMSNGKVADVFTELDSAMDSLMKSNHELKIKEMAIASLKDELGKARELEAELVEKDATLEKMREELSDVKSSEARLADLLSESEKRIREMQAELEKGKALETRMEDSNASQIKQLEEAKTLLEASNAEANAPRDKGKKSEGLSAENIIKASRITVEEEMEGLKFELQLVRENLDRAQESERQSALMAKSLLEEMQLVRNELKQATKAEENSKTAMDDLALVLKEVVTEANQAREKLIATQEELAKFKNEAEELKERLKSIEEKHKTAMDETRREADLHRNTADRLRLEAEESLMAWNGKATGFVDCIKRVEEEKAAALEENIKLIEMLKKAENMSLTAKQENHKLRDILKQALNEASVAKEAARIAQAENSQLKDTLAEKDDALMFITWENEKLRINEVAANENIKELKRLLSEASGKEFKAEEKEHEPKSKQPNYTEKQHSRKLSNNFNFNIKDLITHSKHKDIEEDQRIPEKLNENEEDDKDSENGDPLKGSIFDVRESPIAAPAVHHHRKKSSSAFTLEGDQALNSEDYDQLDGTHMDDLEHERNSRKKKALLRRFGDIIMMRRVVHRRESSIGAGGDQVHKKEPSSAGSEGHKKDPSNIDE